MKNIAILVYGSLINKDELIGEGVDISSCTPVVLKGFRREFSQKSQRPIYLGSNKAVLTVIEDKNSFCNAILVPNIKEKDLEVLDHREAGYNRVKVSLDSLNFKYQALNEKIDEVCCRTLRTGSLCWACVQVAFSSTEKNLGSTDLSGPRSSNSLIKETTSTSNFDKQR